MAKNSKLVYSTDQGRIPASRENTEIVAAATDGIVRIRRETKKRGGKAVSVIEGVPVANLKTVAKQLKNACATGGAVKNLSIEIQGDHRERLKQLLEKEGYQVKLSGG